MKDDDSREGAIYRLGVMHWFGQSWGAPINTPVGEPCGWCEEQIVEGDSGVCTANGVVFHLNCFLRQITGSVSHVLGTCSCVVPGAGETDPPELSRREAATLAVDLDRQKRRM